ncbi:hypothetical protein [Clostridium saccharoperbutylacetonicum]|uniref:hypothetical protein n=1 Tax=Clostridium saccharoperbutylacetonicum TaxID=36745 RepID=UPI0039EC90BD
MINKKNTLKVGISTFLILAAVVGTSVSAFATNKSKSVQKKTQSTQSVLTEAQNKKKIESLIAGARVGLEDRKAEQEIKHDPKVEKFINNMEQKLNELESKKNAVDQIKTSESILTKDNSKDTSYKDLVDEFRQLGK